MNTRERQEPPARRQGPRRHDQEVPIPRRGRPRTAVTLATAGAAAASCRLPVVPSSYSFTGTVQAVDRDGRHAYVHTDDGRKVEVIGTPAESASAVTSVDRHYRAGARYPFHPVNAANPYQDNACTATHELPPRPAQPDAGTPAASTGATDDNARTGTAAAAGIGALLTLTLLVVFLWYHRRTTRRPARNT
jgi:hypothetical protein